MPRQVPLIAGFNAGEFSPLMWARVDYEKYAVASRVMLNMLPRAQGPASRRPGTRYVANTKGDRVARLIPFEFNETNAYIIEATDLTFRFYRNGALIESSPGVPYEVATPYTEAQLDGLYWAQSADVLYLAHPNHEPRTLSRLSDTSWPLATVTFLDGPYLLSRTDITITPSVTSGAGTLTASAALFAATDVGRLVRFLHGSTWGWARITAFSSSTVVNATIIVAGGTTASNAFRMGAFGGTNGFPGVVTFHEDRLCWAATPAQPQTIWGSKTGDYVNHAPGAAPDDPLAFTLSDNTINAIRWMLSARSLLVGTTGGEFSIAPSSQNEALTPTNVKASKQTNHGSSRVRPVQVGNIALFVQRERRTLFELVYTYADDGYVAPDLTVLAEHLTRAGIKEIAWHYTPWRVLWCCLSDGSLVGMTYMREQSVVGWHRHQLGGTASRVLSIATIPTGTVTELYLCVERLVDGVTRRFVERLGDEFVVGGPVTADDPYYVDAGASSALTRPAFILTPSAATGNGVTFTASGSVFSAADLGRIIRVNGGRAVVRTVPSATQVTVDITTALESALPAAAGFWSIASAAPAFAGLRHLAGESVAVLADGAAHPLRTADVSGIIQLDRNASVVHAGFPYESRIESMDLNAGTQDGTAQTRLKRVHNVGVRLYQSLGGQIGYRDEASGDLVLEEMQFRFPGTQMDNAPPLYTGDIKIEFPPRWSRQAVVVIRQGQPLPLTVVGLAPRLTANE